MKSPTNDATSTTTQLPFARSYIAAPRLLAECYPGDPAPSQAQMKLEGLVRRGVGLVINLMEPDEVNHSGERFVDYRPTLEDAARKAGRVISCERLPIRDMDVPTQDHMRKILDTIDQANGAAQLVYVHCWGGKGVRAPSSVATWRVTAWLLARRH